MIEALLDPLLEAVQVSTEPRSGWMFYLSDSGPEEPVIFL